MIKKLLLVGCFLVTSISAFAQENSTDQQESPETLAEQIAIYPNPVTEKLIIANDSNSHLSVTIYNILGDPMVTQNIATNKSYIDVMALPTGIYIVAFSDGKSTTTERLVKN